MSRDEDHEADVDVDLSDVPTPVGLEPYIDALLAEIRDQFGTIVEDLRAENEDLRAEVEKTAERNRRLRERVDEMEDVASRVDSATHAVKRAHDKLDDREAAIEGNTDRILALQEHVSDLDDRTRLQEHVRDASSLKVEERAAICIQTLFNEAQSKRRRGGEPVVAMDCNDSKMALGGSLAREQLQTALRRADELVEGDVLQFKKESRASFTRSTRCAVRGEPTD